MTDAIHTILNELIHLADDHAAKEGVLPTAIPSLFFVRESHVTEPIHAVYKPSFCVILQGEKEVLLAQDRFRYGPADYIVSSVNLPITGQVTKAADHAPYLALKVEFSPDQILDVARLSSSQKVPKKKADRAMYVKEADPDLLQAVFRLSCLLKTPDDIPVLAPLFKKEVLYRLLQGPHAGALQQMAVEGSHANRISHVIDFIMSHFHEPFRIEELADIANMSVSSLHRHFKEVTAMSPIQFQKQLRLQEARRLMLSETIDAAETAFRVGYESPSQFSREYSRLFGLPPKEDVNRLRQHDRQGIGM